MTRTFLSVSEKISDRHRSNYILHNGFEWYHSDTNSKEQMENLLNFFECEITLDHENYSEENGTVKYFNLSKDIISRSNGGFWSFEQLQKLIDGKRVKTFIGLSNGSLTTCYAVFDDENGTIEIIRPNPNAKDVYHTMPLTAEIEYRKNHWFI